MASQFDYPVSGGSAPSSGQTRQQVLDLIAANVAAQARTGNSARWPSAKITLPDSDHITEGSTNEYLTASNLAADLETQLQAVADTNLTISKSGNVFNISGITNENIEDLVGAMVEITAGNSGVTYNYDDTNGKLEFDFSAINSNAPGYAHPSITGFTMHVDPADDESATIGYEVLHQENIRGTSATGQADNNLTLQVDRDGNGTFGDMVLNQTIPEDGTTETIGIQSGSFVPAAGSSYDYRLAAYDTQTPPVRVFSRSVRISTPAMPAAHEMAFYGSAGSVPTTAAVVQALNSADVQDASYSFNISQQVNANDWFFLFVPQNRLPSSIFNTGTNFEAILTLTHQLRAVTIGTQIYDAYVFQNLGLNARYDYRVSRS